MRRLLFVAGLTIISSLALASDRLSNSVPASLPTLKIISQFRDESLTLRGSGLGFCFLGQAYVVTSDHVLLHGDANAVQIVMLLQQKFTAHYLVSDYGHGLGLLALTSADSVCVSWPALETMALAKFEKNQAVAMLGYPAMSDSLIRDLSGRVSDPSVDRGVFVEQTQLIEIAGGHAEFGMSGGVVTNTEGKFAGLLSHQIYSETGSAIQNTILAIPAADVVAWLKGYFSDPDGSRGTTPVTLIQSTPQLISTIGPSASSGNLFFSFLDAFSNGHFELILTTSEGSLSRLYADPPGDLALYSASKKDCVFYIVRFRKRGIVGSGGASVTNFKDSLRMLTRTDLEPVTLLSCNDSEDAIRELSAIYKQLRLLSDRDQGVGAEGLLKVLRGYLDFIYNQDPDQGMGSYFEVKPQDLERLESNPIYASSWIALRAKGVDGEWRKALDHWIETMRHLAI